MRGIRAVVVTLAFVVGGVLGLSGSTLTEPDLGCADVSTPSRVQASPRGASGQGSEIADGSGALVRAAFALLDRGASAPRADGAVCNERARSVLAQPRSGPRSERVSGPRSDSVAAPAAQPAEPPARPATEPVAQPAAQAAEPAPVPRTSIATRHIPDRTDAAEAGSLHPATDRAMALLIGWALLALLGGGLFAGRLPRRRTGI